jgi:anti-sigma regulatory factor (Ser/Thr protein kinase)
VEIGGFTSGTERVARHSPDVVECAELRGGVSPGRSIQAHRRGRLEHPALLYADLNEFLSVMVPFVEAGVDGGEVVFIAAGSDCLNALRGELGARASRVTWADTFKWHPNPATRLRAFYELVSDEIAAGASAFRLAGEPVWPSGPPELVREWQRYESALNAVLAPFPVNLICLYDTTSLDPSVIAGARRTHPTIHQFGTNRPSREFEPPEDFLRRWKSVPPRPPADAARLSDASNFSEARRFLSEQAASAGIDADRADDLCIAANEVLTNAFIHATGASLAAWSEDRRLICHIEDRGRGIGDPLAGYRPPSQSNEAGRGLWIARQLVDLVEILAGPSGTIVRLHVNIN